MTTAQTIVDNIKYKVLDTFKASSQEEGEHGESVDFRSGETIVIELQNEEYVSFWDEDGNSFSASREDMEYKISQISGLAWYNKPV